jgi:hypothetical protein
MKQVLFMLIALCLYSKGKAQSFSNGDFQNGTTSWQVNGAQHANYGINGDPATNYYFDVTPNGGSGNGASVEQKVGFKINCNYAISFQIRPGGPVTNNKTAGIRVEMDGQVIAPGRFTSNNWKAWTTVTTNPVYISTGSHVFKFIGDNGEDETPQVMGLDNIIIKRLEKCVSDSVPLSGGCCPGKNLICNGGFEENKNCFESQYQPKGKGGFRPGTYTIIDYETAAQLCKSWVFNNALCQRSGKALFVNGNTNGQGSKLIWQQTVSFNGWKQYRFCANVYAFTQCCFNVTPKLTVKLTYTSNGQTKTIVIDEIKPDNCGWVNYTKYIAPWEGNDGGKATLSISVDESGIGDGNDFVVDNIFLTELQPIDKAITNSVSITPAANGNITGTFSGTLPVGTGFGWYIVTLDANGQPDANCPEVANPQTWWTATTNFPGFDGCKINGNSPGKLLPGKTYKIVFGTFGPCYAWDAVVFTVLVDPATGKIKLLKKDDIPLQNDPIFKKLPKLKELDLWKMNLVN